MDSPTSDQEETTYPAGTARKDYQSERSSHWDAIALQEIRGRGLGGYYHKRLEQIYKFLVPPEQRVLELGCSGGHLLAALMPEYGVGIDFSPEMIQQAIRQYPNLHFIQADVHHLILNDKFDAIILSDLVNDLWDVQTVFEQITRWSTPHTRIILNMYSRLWELPLRMAGRLGLVKPTLYQNWLTVEDIDNLLNLADFEVIRSWSEFLWPVSTPILASFINNYLVKFWPIKIFALTNFVLARPCPSHIQHQAEKAAKEQGYIKQSVSIIIPARNEAGNIPKIFTRTPRMGKETELVFVEGHSNDDTYGVIDREIVAHPEWKCQLIPQTGIGKGDAVRLGFEKANGEIMMIMDADLTVPPEDLPRFYEALVSGKGEFINGVRLVYPMENQAMRFLNLIGNKFFSLAFSWLLGQPIKDTLCGTKAMWKYDYNRIAANRKYFGDFDPFGDYDLLFGAAKLGLKIVDLPIRYRERTYGQTNIQRWRHGWLLLKMVFFAAWRIKFV